MLTTFQNGVGIWFYFMFTVSNEHTVRYIVLPIPKFREWINCIQIGGWCQYDCIIFPPTYSSDPNAIFIIPIDSTWITHFGEMYFIRCILKWKYSHIFHSCIFILCVNVFPMLAGSPFRKVLLFWIKWTWGEHEEIKRRKNNDSSGSYWIWCGFSTRRRELPHEFATHRSYLFIFPRSFIIS